MRGIRRALVLSLAAAAAAAQPVPAQGQTGADQAIDARLRLVADTLHDSAARLDGSADIEGSEAIRQAIGRAHAMLSGLPAAPGQDATLARARTALSGAEAALAGPDPKRAAAELRTAAEAMASLRPGLGTITPRRP